MDRRLVRFQFQGFLILRDRFFVSSCGFAWNFGCATTEVVSNDC